MVGLKTIQRGENQLFCYMVVKNEVLWVLGGSDTSSLKLLAG